MIGPEENRTPDLYVANVALSQLSYRPIANIDIYFLFDICLQFKAKELITTLLTMDFKSSLNQISYHLA